MNTNDLPLAQQLAALMEAGRACNPNVEHVRRSWGDGKRAGCAMTFAALGAGVTEINGNGMGYRIAKAIGADPGEVVALMERVIHMNDSQRATMDEIIAAVRDGTLPEVPRQTITMEQFKSLYEEVLAMPKPSPHYFKTYTWIGVDMAKPDTIEVKSMGALPDLTPTKAVRVGKNGATWPVPKHAYA